MHAEERPVGRCLYVPPALKEFGPVGALTQSGSGNAVEMTMMKGGCSGNPMAAMC